MIWAVAAAGAIGGYVLVAAMCETNRRHRALVGLLVSKGLINKAEYEATLEYVRRGERLRPANDAGR